MEYYDIEMVRVSDGSRTTFKKASIKFLNNWVRKNAKAFGIDLENGTEVKGKKSYKTKLNNIRNDF